MTFPKQTIGWSDRRICWIAVLIVVLFIVDGSLVPFDLSWSADFDVHVWVRQVHYTAWALVAPTDVIVNALVGAPLGFFLMGALRSNGRLLRPLALFAVAALSATIATSVELLQVFSTLRQSSWNDVCAQTLGAIVGASAWLVLGGRFMSWLRRFHDDREPVSFVARVLQIYFPIYLLLQLTPVEAITAAELLNHEHTALVLLPVPNAFEFHLLAAREVAGTVLLNIPIGMLAVVGWMKPGERRPAWRALLIGLGILLMAGLPTSSARWSLVFAGVLIAGILGMVIGLVAAARGWLQLRPRVASHSRLRRWVRICLSVWLLVMALQAWQPSNREVIQHFANEASSSVLSVPLDTYRVYSASPVQALHDVLLEMLVAFPLGFLLSFSGPVPGGARARPTQGTMLIGLMILMLIGVELCGLLLPTRALNTIDMLVSAAGALAGLAAGTQLSRCWQTA